MKPIEVCGYNFKESFASYERGVKIKRIDFHMATLERKTDDENELAAIFKPSRLCIVMKEENHRKYCLEFFMPHFFGDGKAARGQAVVRMLAHDDFISFVDVRKIQALSYRAYPNDTCELILKYGQRKGFKHLYGFAKYDPLTLSPKIAKELSKNRYGAFLSGEKVNLSDSDTIAFLL